MQDTHQTKRAPTNGISTGLTPIGETDSGVAARNINPTELQEALTANQLLPFNQDTFVHRGVPESALNG